MLSQVRRSVFGSCASARQKLLTKSDFRTLRISSKTARASAESSSSESSFTVAMGYLGGLIWHSSVPRLRCRAGGVTGRGQPRLALPLGLRLRWAAAAGLLDLDRHAERLRAAAIAGAAQGGGAEIVEPEGDTDMGIGGADAVGRIESDPAEIGNVGLRPGVA